jgi:CRP-like cAMP-binding protein
MESAIVDGRWARFHRGSLIYHADTQGEAWRVVSGSVRLDRSGIDGLSFGGLAVSGDIIGMETLMFGRYSFAARALSLCTLERWTDDKWSAPSDNLLWMLTHAQQRAAQLIAMRCGRPIERIRRLMCLLARPAPEGQGTRIAVPRLSDMAEITNLTPETVSRTLSELRRQGEIERTNREMALLHIDSTAWAA